ncbi:alpha/beta fold hydrolase [Aquihabitans sp. McL0605]|uniref:alpha/beta fold hydrolase n=1 Tax=Aquihabitans sp. McL0605 TaxID=3415671 RepID=UPI003CFBB959
MLLHGVGVGPESFAAMAELLEDRHRVVALERPVGPGGTALPLPLQADLLATLLAEVGALGARLVGVSGGATLGLCLGIRHPQTVSALALHEPLVGALAPELHSQFQRSAAIASAGEPEAMEVVRAVMGDATWASLGPEGQAASSSHAVRWRGEIAQFAAFDPSVADLTALRPLPLLVTVGSRSGPERWAAAEQLRRWAAADLVEVPGAGNAAQIDAPQAFTEIVTAWQTVPSGGSA